MRTQKKPTHLLIGSEINPEIKMIWEYTHVKIPSHPEYQFIVHHKDGDSEEFSYSVSEKSTGMGVPFTTKEIMRESINCAIAYVSVFTKEQMAQIYKQGYELYLKAKENEHR